MEHKTAGQRRGVDALGQEPEAGTTLADRLHSTISRRSFRDRPRRSYLVTITTSPLRICSSILSSSGRARLDPLILSAKTFSAPTVEGHPSVNPGFGGQC